MNGSRRYDQDPFRPRSYDYEKKSVGVQRAGVILFFFAGESVEGRDEHETRETRTAERG